MEEAKSCARLDNKNKIYMIDIQNAILKVMNGTINIISTSYILITFNLITIYLIYF